MPPTPRPQGPKKKANVKVPSPPNSGGGGAGVSKGMLIGLGALGLIVVAAVGGYFVFAGGSSAASNAPKLLEDAGCTVQVVKAEKSNDHSILTPTGVSAKWNTSPPTSGPHYAVPVLWGAYTAPVNLGQIVHNLEHGGVYILYGPRVPAATVAQLRTFYDGHRNATVMAPLPSLGDKIALGVWTTKSANQPDTGTAYLAKCTSFDDAAFAAFFKAFQGKGPERFPMVSLAPGS
jgi:hypothetical protein